jgi:hypothetical protein
MKRPEHDPLACRCACHLTPGRKAGHVCEAVLPGDRVRVVTGMLGGHRARVVSIRPNFSTGGRIYDLVMLCEDPVHTRAALPYGPDEFEAEA